jgi:hypothetical protein
MHTIALISGNTRPATLPSGGDTFAQAASPAMRKAIVNACDDWMTVGEFYESPSELTLNPNVIPVLTTLVSPADRLLLETRRQTFLPVLGEDMRLHTALFDHPHNSGMRNKAGRLCLNGITVRYKEGVPHRPDRVKNDWGLKPWADPASLPRKLMHCPSNKQDEYATFLQRDEATSIIEVNAIMATLVASGIIGPDWEIRLRPWQAPNAKGGVMQAIREHFAVIDGNSVLLLDALREGRYALVWEQPGKPLAHVLASYNPLRLSDIEDGVELCIDREPLFEFLDNVDVPFEALDNRTLKNMIAWQIEHLDVP